MSAASLEPGAPQEVAEAVATTGGTLVPRGAGTKPALSSPTGDAVALELGALCGVVEYEPSEFTVTALAGTPVAELETTLREHGQYLPFDPLYAGSGATIGGSVAVGANGPGRVRYGGVRDFVLGVRLVDGRGRLVRGGGKVVKNAAGFDLPKLMVGSLGRLGVLVELTFKVFPAPEATRSLRAELPTLGAAVDVMRRLTGRPFDLDAMELVPPGELWVRIAGPEGVLAARAERLAGEIRRGGAAPVEVVSAGEADAHWASAREISWAGAAQLLLKVPVTPGRIAAIDGRLPAGARRRYGGAGQQLLLGWPASENGSSVNDLSRALHELGLRGLVLRSPPDLGAGTVVGPPGDAGGFAQRVKAAMDPDERFLPLP